MSKPVVALVATLLCVSASASASAADLSPLEQRWLAGMAPVIAFARATKLPLDVIVQPQPTPGLTPLGMAFVDGRCKLVLSMRGNATAQTTLDEVEPALLNAAIELMAAHELGHCARYLAGTFAHLPAGFTAAAEPPSAQMDMQTLRREEGYADLIGLAWTQQRHPELYTRLHGWLAAARSTDAVRGSEHDTTAWLQLAQDGTALADPSIFSNVTRLWSRGLQAADGP